MPLAQLFKFVSERSRRHRYSEKLVDRITEVVKATWYLGFTSFGGPPVHFQIFHQKFVEDKNGRTPWIDEQTYQELFALCQALPGPASTKMLFAIVSIHAGWVPAIIAFLMWSLPGATGMFGLSLGVRRISETLPEPAYAFLSGLNASSVGIIAVAAVQLSEKCIKDPLSRLLVIFGACAGLCYSALWYYPVLVITGGIATMTWDIWLGRKVRRLKQTWEARRRRAADQAANSENDGEETVSRHEGEHPLNETHSIGLRVPEPAKGTDTDTNITRRRQGQAEQLANVAASSSTTYPEQVSTFHVNNQRQSVLDEPYFGVSVRIGLSLLTAFIISFITILVTRSQLPREYRPLSLFANLYLAGTIIFGGGPVVIPLLREYVVYPGWVSPRDFLIGLAIIQAFPGPNFNFSTYVGALAVADATSAGNAGDAFLGAVLGFVGIFLPGLVIHVTVQSLWGRLRSRPLFLALLRGINATAVGLVFTAVYRLWEVGYLTNESTNAGDTGVVQGGRFSGRSLADEPWWVVVAVLTYAGNKWFGVPAAAGIAVGGILGLAWWGATQ